MSTKASWVLVGLALTFVLPASAFAWASKTTPICEKVHQEAIANVLEVYLDPNQKTLTSSVLKILQDQQDVVDKDQKAFQSYEHAMTGVEANENADQRRPVFIAETEGFIHKQLSEALQAKKGGRNEVSLAALGKAIHPLQDATSPAHRPFQAWKYNETLWSKAVHLWHENSYPDEGTSLRSDLENAVRWALDIYFERTPIPEHFFRPDGELDFPAPYRPSSTTTAI